MKTFMKVNAVALVVGIVLVIVGCVTMRFKWRSYSVETTSYEEKISAEEWKNASNLEIDAGFANLRVKKGNEFKLVADEVPERLAAHLTADGDTIILKSDEIKGTDLLKSSGINIHSAGTYTLYIPDSKYIENLSVDFCFGELTITDIYTNNADIAISYSDSELALAALESLNIDASFGDTDIDMLLKECRSLTVTSSFGDCDIKNARITESASFYNSFGDFDIQLIGDDYDIDSDNAFGDSDVSGSNPDGKVKIYVTNSFGDTDISAKDSPKKK